MIFTKTASTDQQEEIIVNRSKNSQFNARNEVCFYVASLREKTYASEITDSDSYNFRLKQHKLLFVFLKLYSPRLSSNYIIIDYIILSQRIITFTVVSSQSQCLSSVLPAPNQTYIKKNIGRMVTVLGIEECQSNIQHVIYSNAQTMPIEKKTVLTAFNRSSNDRFFIFLECDRPRDSKNNRHT